MAFSPEAFVTDPPFHEIKRRPIPIRVSREEAINILLTRVAHVAIEARRPLHGPSRSRLPLFSMSVSWLGQIPEEASLGQTATALLEKGELQDVGIEVMAKFGFNPKAFIVKGRIPRGNGTFFEKRIYPSQTIRGLEFERHTDMSKDGNPIFAHWSVRDNAPTFNFNPNLKPTTATAS